MAMSVLQSLKPASSLPAQRFCGSTSRQCEIRTSPRSFQETAEALRSLIGEMSKGQEREEFADFAQGLLAEMTELYDTMRDSSIRDGLTNIYNRRFFDETLVSEVNRCRKNRFNLSVVFVDLDVFGQINKRYGTPVGDEVLRSMANTLKATVRASDYFCRYGGEEFVLVAPRTTLEGAKSLAKRILKTLPTITQKWKQHEGPSGSMASRLNTLATERDITTSIGVAHVNFEADDLQEPEELVKWADDAANESKSQGRNRLYASTPQNQGQRVSTFVCEGPPATLPEKNANVTPLLEAVV